MFPAMKYSYNNCLHTAVLKRCETLQYGKSNEQGSGKTNNVLCANGEDFDQPAHLCSLIRIFTVCMSNSHTIIIPFGGQTDSDQSADVHDDLSLCCFYMQYCLLCYDQDQIRKQSYEKAYIFSASKQGSTCPAWSYVQSSQGCHWSLTMSLSWTSAFLIRLY